MRQLKKHKNTPKRINKYPYLDAQELHNRAGNLGRSNLMFFFSIMKAISLYAAVTAFIYLCNTIPNSNDSLNIWKAFWLHVTMFTAGFLLMIVTYDGANIGSIFVTRMPRGIENIILFIQSGLECTLFILLNPLQILENINMNITLLWYFIYAIVCCLASSLIFISRLNIFIQDFPTKYSNLILSFRNDITSQIKGSLISASFATAATIITYVSAYTILIQNVLITIDVILIALLILAFVQQHIQKRRIEKHLSRT